MIIKDEEIIRNNHLLSELKDYIMQKFIEIDKQKKNNLEEVKKILCEEKLTVLYIFPEDKDNITNKNEINKNNKENDLSAFTDYKSGLINLPENKKIIKLDPQNHLTFNGPFNIQKSSILKIKNITNSTIIFKVKATAPDNYIVNPNYGKIDANDVCVCEIKINSNIKDEEFPPDFKCNDKFLIQSVIIEDEEIIRNNHLLSELRDYIMQKFIEIDKQKKNNLKEVKKILYEEKLTVLYTFPEDKKNKNLLTNKKIEYEDDDPPDYYDIINNGDNNDNINIIENDNSNNEKSSNYNKDNNKNQSPQHSKQIPINNPQYQTYPYNPYYPYYMQPMMQPVMQINPYVQQGIQQGMQQNIQFIMQPIMQVNPYIQQGMQQNIQPMMYPMVQPNPYVQQGMQQNMQNTMQPIEQVYPYMQYTGQACENSSPINMPRPFSPQK
ncbi:hypothetical protein LY90DRAFT_664758 [Neocallimastix californiae]|uniref:MSP domain-containing protein n=1 Tax=Neocallimastix californiae TaxID=1754190 RepID=A0A1Y2F5E5_9FUNG|nr:hypothetical protein LY90DRAFT_664758 [Neocallimastix californiae]|eukprot:ORY79130.1 hypothetical protein LY90DRAFT_664758 [Neocallimastix californiae]